MAEATIARAKLRHSTVLAVAGVVASQTLTKAVKDTVAAQATKALSTSAYRRKEGKNEICSFD